MDVSDFVSELARAGIVTTRHGVAAASRRVWLEFATSDDALVMLNVIARYVPEGDPFHARIFAGSGNPRGWTFGVRPVDAGRRELTVFADPELNWVPPPSYRFSTLVQLPQEDLTILTELLRDYNQRG